MKKEGINLETNSEELTKNRYEMNYYSTTPIRKIESKRKLVFLAGSIDLELAGDWRVEVTKELEEDFDFLDPTTADYASLTEAEWDEHIKWELQGMEMADYILINFLPESTSPISLVELGLNIRGKKIVVVCPKTFYKTQYVTALCQYYQVTIFSELRDGINLLKEF